MSPRELVVPRTLRGRLTLAIAVLVLAVLVVVGGTVYFTTAHRLWAAFDASLRVATAQAMAGTNNENGVLKLGPALDEGTSAGDSAAPGLGIAVYTPAGAVLRESGPAVGPRLPAGALQAALAGWATTAVRAVEPAGTSYRVLTTPLREDGTTLAVFSVARSQAPTQSTLRQLAATLLVLVPVAAAVAALLGHLLTGRMLRPLATITRTAAEISSHDLTRRIGLPAGVDEVGSLAATFDGMLGRLDDSFRRERQFVADASHELRTPLTAIRTIVGVTRERSRTAADYEVALRDVDAEAERLNDLVEGLLELARGDADGVADPSPVDLAVLLRDVCASLSPVAEAKGVALGCEVPDGLVVDGDGDALVSLFVNLVDNAVKYTSEGAVTLSARRAHHTVQVSIADTGCGVPADQLPHLFDRFFRGDASRSARGTGLGLAIARQAAEAHGGSISVTSEVGRGSTFVVSLPAPRGTRPVETGGSEGSTRRRQARRSASRTSLESPG